MKISRKYLKKFKNATRQTNKNAMKILAIEDRAFNRRSAMGLNEDNHVRSCGQQLYQFMLDQKAIKSHSNYQEFTGLNHGQLKAFKDQHHLSDASLDESLKQINRLS